MLLSGPADELDGMPVDFLQTLRVDFLLVEHIPEIAFLLSLALDCPVLHAVLVVIELAQPLLVLLLSGFLVHLQLAEHIAFGEVHHVLLLGILPQGLLALLLLVGGVFEGEPREGDSALVAWVALMSLEVAVLILLELKLGDILCGEDFLLEFEGINVLLDSSPALQHWLVHYNIKRARLKLIYQLLLRQCSS